MILLLHWSHGAHPSELHLICLLWNEVANENPDSCIVQETLQYVLYLVWPRLFANGTSGTLYHE